MHVRTVLATMLLIVAAIAAPVGATGGGATTAAQCTFPFASTDATGTEVTVEAEPEQIVTLSPSAAQTMWEIGGREKVIGVSEYASYLDGADTRTNISGAGRAFVNVEQVISLEPDLVLAPNTIPNETVDQLREAGLTVYKFPFATSIEDIEQKTLLTGRLTGECEGARETVDWMNDQLATVDAAVEGEERPRVLYVFFEYTAGKGTFVHTVIERGGGTNIAAAANITSYQPISREVVVAHDPQWIVVNDGATQLPDSAAYNNTHAVANDQIVVVQEEYISQPAPRIVRSVVTLAKAFHPEAYQRAAATETATETPAETATASEATAAETTTESTPDGAAAGTATPGQPGFGAPALIGGLVVLALLARRR